jgi:putative zinc metallopeptidase family protein
MTVVINPHVRVGPLLQLGAGGPRRFVDGADCGRLLAVDRELGDALEGLTRRVGERLEDEDVDRALGSRERSRELLRQGVLRVAEDADRPVAAPAARPGRLHLFDPAPLLPVRPAPIGVLVPLVGVLAVVVLTIAAVTTRGLLADSVARSLREPVLLLVAAVLLVGCVLVHELGHALALSAGGGRSRSIGLTLYPLPGLYTEMRSVYLLDSRWDRAAVFLAGPVTTALVSLVLLIAGTFLREAAPGAAATLTIAVWANVLLGLVNLLPVPGSDAHQALRHLGATTPPSPLTTTRDNVEAAS